MRSKSFIFSIVAGAILIASFAFQFGPLHIATSHAAPHFADQVTATSYSVPSGTSLPWGTTYDSKKRIWVALPGCDPNPTCDPTFDGQIGVFDPTTASWITVHQLPSGFTQAFFLAFDKKGNLWFPLPMANAIGKYDTSTHVFKEWTVPTSGAGPWDLAIDANGIIWFTEHFSNKIGSFNPVTKQFTEIATPAQNSQPYGITIDAYGNKWFTENNSSVALIGEYTAQGTLLEYKIRNTYDGNLTPHLITVDPNGNIWWTEGFVGMIARLKINKAQPGTNNGVTEYAYPRLCGCGTHTSGIDVDSSGNVWFDDSIQGIYGFFPDGGKGAFKVFTAPDGLGSNDHPHDGLMVDPKNRVWFDEEFAEKLAVAIKAPAASTTITG
jgi:streptogramin lyase